MAVPEKNGIRYCIFSLQKIYNVVDVFNKRHKSWLYVTCDNSRTLHHGPESPVSFTSSWGADAWLLLPSAGRPVDSLSAVVVVLDGEPSVTLSAFILACSGLSEPLRLWWLLCLFLRGLGLRDLIFMRTTVLSSSELKSELSEELLSRPEVGSWIWG